MLPNYRAQYTWALELAITSIHLGDKSGAMEALKVAMRCANTANDKRYRRAVFRALSFTRRIPVAA